MRFSRHLCLAVGIVLSAQPAQDSAHLRARLGEIQARLSQVDRQMDALKKRRKGILVELQGIALQTDRIRAQADGARLKRDQTQAQVEAVQSQKVGIQREIQRLQGDIRKQVRWMQAVGPWGGLGFMTNLKSFEQYLVQGRYLAWRRNRERLRLSRIQALHSDLHRQEGALQEILKRLVTEEQEAASLGGDLKFAEARLNGFLDGLRQDETRQKAIQAELAEEAIQLERMVTSLLAKPRSDAFAPPQAFTSLAGELPRPVEGSLAQSFGEHLHPKYRTRTTNSGLLIEAPAGTPVQAVAEGKVVFADFYQSYGPMVILDHGSGFYTLYTHLRVAHVNKGQVLRQGDILGTVGETLDGPRLGFEVRQQTQAQDPNRWLKQKYR
ncbi:murein hydrolase activator EnvC family protein [Holophaga foetida]|uniref:murein hydrolase activator EnvC family protein n=1 Tax=Holophaga foetida TaxID=35839 RepID=UPI0002474981|nr:M23 family metallopeptidase [Holophaga foetida]